MSGNTKGERNMKEQIERIECGTDDGEFYTLICNNNTITLRNGETDTKAPILDEDHDRLLEQVCKLIEDNPDAEPVLEPYHSAVYLRGNEASPIPLPYSKLNQLMADAWFDAERLLASLRETQFAGAVACPQDPSAPFDMGMMPFMRMDAETMAQKQAEMIEQLHAKGIDEAAAEQRKRGFRIDNETWNCGCGQQGLHSKFCPECGMPAPPLIPETWNCPNCGTKELHSRFCPNCGTPAQ